MLERMLVIALLVAASFFRLDVISEAAEDEWSPAEIHVPEGFSVEVAAAPPLVKHPMMATFDDRGRLFIAESAGENLRRADLEEQLPNFVRMIEDTTGDGKFDKSTVFADKMTFPQGALWHQDSLYVASSGGIWRLQDTDDDGVADVRELIVDEFGYTGNAADVHGCFLGPCGRIYWCEGRHGHEFTDEGGHILSKGKAARIFSCKPDGSDVQIHCGGGMDNPVEIDFLESGEMLGTVNLFYRQRGDCLVHWMHGGVYPRFDQPQVVAEFKRTGDLLPPVANLGHVAVSGTTRYRSSTFDEKFLDNFFITEFNTHKVVRAKLSRTGSTFAADVNDFLSCDDGDFHPTDVLEDADGSLLVIDTGGWFRIGCPTSQIAKPNILGAIYRIRRNDALPANDPRGKDIDWSGSVSKLAKRLDDQRFAVRDRAIREIAQLGENAVPSLATSLSADSVRMRRNSVWALSRIDSATATNVIRSRLADEDPTVRQAATMSLGIRGNREAAEELVERLQDSEPSVRREAATSLGKLHRKETVAPILAALSDDAIDRVMEHALIFALIDIDAPTETAIGLAASNTQVQRAALIVLDQMEHGNLQRSQVTSLLNTPDLALQRAVIDVISRHPEWSEEVVALAASLVSKQSVGEEAADSASQLLLAFISNAPVQQFVANRLGDKTTPNATVVNLLGVVRDANLSAAPDSWSLPVLTHLESRNTKIVDAAVAAAAKFDVPAIRTALINVASNKSFGDDLRVRAVAACSTSNTINDELFDFLTNQITADNTPTTRRLAASRALGTSALTDRQLGELVSVVSEASPLELSSLLMAFERASDEQVGMKLVSGLQQSPGLASISVASLDRVVAGFPDSVKTLAKQLRGKIAATNSEQIGRLESLEGQMEGGDLRRGKAVFEGQRTSCITCHSVSGKGGRVGPDLSTTGSRRTVRDILEAVLYPNSSLARGFESFAVVTTDGKVHTGLILSETTETIRLRTTDQREVTILRDEIDELQPSQVSVMPTGLDRTMSEDDLRDLVAYLTSLKGDH